MSSFDVKVTRIRAIEPIENADMIELAVVGDYRSVVRKGDFRAGDLAVYIPEASLLPERLIEKMGLTGKLAGKDKNRVKAVKLRGCLSQGLLLKLDSLTIGKSAYTVSNVLEFYNTACDRVDRMVVWEGDNVTPYLGITKYEPVIPAQFAGEVYNAGYERTVNYDIENFKKYPDILLSGEQVVFTEKVHGTFCGVGYLPDNEWSDKHYRQRFVVFSKGMGAQGLCFRHTENNVNNIYIRVLEELGVFDKIQSAAEVFHPYLEDKPFFVLGEVFGAGVQDLTYGTQKSTFRIFDVALGYRGHQTYYDADKLESLAEKLQLPHVPILYKGPFSKEIMLEHTRGKETVSGTSAHVREGIVIRPAQERFDPEIGRVILKSVSEEYILRRGGTEYN